MAEQSGVTDDVKGNDSEIQGSPEEETFLVEKILRKKIVDRVPYYRVKWLGYPSSENTWEPLESFPGSCMNLVNQFNEEENLKKTKRRRKRSPIISDYREKDTEEVGASHLEARQGSVKQPRTEGENGFNPNQTGSRAEIFAANAFGKMFRQSWKDTEVPVAIIYSVLFENSFLYVVRIQPATEEEPTEMLMDPCENANRKNTVIVSADNFVKWYPELVVKFHDSQLSPNDEHADVNMTVVESRPEVGEATMDIYDIGEQVVDMVDPKVTSRNLFTGNPTGDTGGAGLYPQQDVGVRMHTVEVPVAPTVVQSTAISGEPTSQSPSTSQISHYQQSVIRHTEEFSQNNPVPISRSTTERGFKLNTSRASRPLRVMPPQRKSSAKIIQLQYQSRPPPQCYPPATGISPPIVEPSSDGGAGTSVVTAEEIGSPPQPIDEGVKNEGIEDAGEYAQQYVY